MGKTISKALLISDIDDTLLGDSSALSRFNEFFSKHQLRLSLAYASGRFFDSIRSDIQKTELPEPVAIIGGVGSEIRYYPSGNLDQEWVEQASQNWSAQTVRKMLAKVRDLELQPEQFQSQLKVSYYYRNATNEQLSYLRTELLNGGIKADLIYSSQRDLDFLPCGVNKGAAAAFLARKLDFPSDRVIVAGNSGNDAKLFEQGFCGVVVANAHEELKQIANTPKIYLSPYSYAEGVRDGLRHWIQEMTEDE